MSPRAVTPEASNVRLQANPLEFSIYGLRRDLPQDQARDVRAI